MTDYIESLEKAAARNGRESADALAECLPQPWNAERYGQVLDHLAIALAATFPGGPTNFLALAKDVLPPAREGFEARLRELGIEVYPQDAAGVALTLPLDPAPDADGSIERVTGRPGRFLTDPPSKAPATIRGREAKNRLH